MGWHLHVPFFSAQLFLIKTLRYCDTGAHVNTYTVPIYACPNRAAIIILCSTADERVFGEGGLHTTIHEVKSSIGMGLSITLSSAIFVVSQRFKTSTGSNLQQFSCSCCTSAHKTVHIEEYIFCSTQQCCTVFF